MEQNNGGGLPHLDLDAMIGDAGTATINSRVLRVRNIDGLCLRMVQGAASLNETEAEAVLRRVLQRLVPDATAEDLDSLTRPQVEALLQFAMRSLTGVEKAIAEGNAGGVSEATAPTETPNETPTLSSASA